MTAISALSTQYIWVPIRADHPISGKINIASTQVAVAIVTDTPTVDDWTDATWESTEDTVNGVDYWLARLKVGPDGAVTLDDGTYQVWARITTADETPVLRVGELTVY